ncbi:MAG TPA: DUF4184 family protein [Candidatus Acidoferrum sp.]|nr:DUF4184 family protein [Candidatus Acidoferrum sp.]
MAFPLAHPAAVLPLRRFCPRWLSFPALVVGSVAPDSAYVLQAWHVDVLSHSLIGSVAFSLPVGLATMLIFYAVRTPMAKRLPAPYQRALLPLCQRPPASVWVLALSILIGSWTHLFWDSCTHKDGWFALHIPGLNLAVFTLGYHTARVSLLLWYASSFAGMVWLVLAFEKWRQTRVRGAARVPGKAVLRDAALVALLLLPIGAVHHLLQRTEVAVYVVAAICAVPATWVILKMSSSGTKDADGPDAAG